MMVDKRVALQLGDRRKEALKKQASDKKPPQRDTSKVKTVNKDSKTEVKRVVGSAIPEEVVKFVTPMDERRAKRNLESLFLSVMYDGIVNKVRLLEEEQLKTSMNRLWEIMERMEKVKNFIKNELVVSNEQTNATRIRRYSTSDSAAMKLALTSSLPPLNEDKGSKSTPPNTCKVKGSPTKTALGSKTAIPVTAKRLNTVSDTSNPNPKSSLVKPTRARTPRTNTSSAAKLGPNSPTKLQSVAPRTPSSSPAPLKSPTTKVVSESLSPKSPADKPLAQESFDHSTLGPPIKTSPEQLPPIIAEKISIASLSATPLSNTSDAKPQIEQLVSSTPICNTPSVFLTITSPDKGELSSEPDKDSPANLQDSRTLSISPTHLQCEPPTINHNVGQTNTTTSLQSKLPTHVQATRQVSSPVYNSPKSPNSTQSPKSPNSAQSPNRQSPPKQATIPSSCPSPRALHSKLVPPTTRSTTKIGPVSTRRPRSVSQTNPGALSPRYAKKIGVNVVEPIHSYRINSDSSTTGILLEEDCFISSSPKNWINFMDLQTHKINFSLNKKVAGVVRRMEYRYSDKLLFTLCGKTIQIFDTRTRDLAFELNNDSDASLSFQSFCTTRNPNVIHVSLGSTILTWDYSRNKIVDTITSTAPHISSMYSGVKKDDSPFIVTFCQDKYVYAYDKASMCPASLSSDSALVSSVPDLEREDPSRPQDPRLLYGGDSRFKPVRLEGLVWDSWTSLVHYDDTLLFTNGRNFYQHSLLDMTFVKKFDSVHPDSTHSDITHMRRVADQPFLVTSFRCGKIKVLDLLKFTPYSKNDYVANCQSICKNASVMKMSCSKTMIATICSKDLSHLQFWKLNMERFS